MSDYQQHITSSTLIHTGKGKLNGLVASINGSSPVNLTCYDNTVASGTIIFKAAIAPADDSQPFALFFQDRFAPRFSTGLYISLGGATLEATIWATGV